MNTQKELVTAFQEYQEGTFVKAKGKFIGKDTPTRSQDESKDDQ